MTHTFKRKDPYEWSAAEQTDILECTQPSLIQKTIFVSLM